MRNSIPALIGFVRTPWNRDRLIGQKRPLKPKEVWATRIRLQLEKRRCDLALLNLAIDNELRGCDLVRLQVYDICVGGQVRDRAALVLRKTGRPVQLPAALSSAAGSTVGLSSPKYDRKVRRIRGT